MKLRDLLANIITELLKCDTLRDILNSVLFSQVSSSVLRSVS